MAEVVEELEAPEDGYQDVDESEGLPSPDPELAGMNPVFADSDEDDDESSDSEVEDEPEEEFYQKGQKPSYESLARELRHRDRDHGILQQRFNQMAGMVEQYQNMLSQLQTQLPETENEDQLPDINEDPAGHLLAKLDAVLKVQEETKEEQQRKEQEKQLSEALNTANRAVLQYRENCQDGAEAYDEMLDYLVDTTITELEYSNPGMTRSEIEQRMQVGIEQQKLQFLQAGQNPGHMWYQMALNRGWKPGTYGRWAQQQMKNKKNDPRQQIRQQKKRNQKARTVGKMGGAAGGGQLTARKALLMDEEQWNEATKGMKLRDILAGKARPDQG